MRRLLLIALFPLLLAADTQPAVRLAGTLNSKSTVTRVVAIDRAWADVLKTSEKDPKDPFLYSATFDAAGKFHIDKLLPGRSYDLIVWTTAADGTVTRWEGVSMDYHRPIKPSTEVTDEDRKSINTLVTEVPQFYDKTRILKLAADHQHATALVELMRTRDFHSDTGGEVIYRVELWYFENLFGGWAKDANTEKVIARVRGKPGDIQQNWQFIPQLGNLPAVPATAPAPAPIELPEKTDPKHGIAGGIKLP